MSDQERMKEGGVAQVSEMPDAGMVSDEGFDAEVKDDAQDKSIQQSHSISTHEKNNNNASRSTGKDSSGDSPRKHRNSSDRRRHHHHHSSNSSSSSHHKRKRSGGHSGEDGEDVEDGSRSRRRSDSAGDDHVSSLSGGSSTRSSHKHRGRRSSHSQRSRHHDEPSQRGQAESTEDTASSSSHSRKAEKLEKEKVDAEAEDGEILEDGELDDDDDDNNNNDDMALQEESRFSQDTSHEDLEESAKSKSLHKEDGKSQKRDKKKADRREKRKKEDDKKKRKKYVDIDKQDEEEPGPAPAWGSGYQGVKAKGSSHTRQSHSPPPPYGKSTKGGRDKGYQSPPGLYDSPSYSEGSEDEHYSRAMFSEGYLDASVAADEKEGIFKRSLTPKRKKRMDRGYGKRRQDFGKSDGPPKKKALTEMAMSDRPKCKFYKDGKCAKGSGCPFNHDMEQNKRMEVCKYHLTVKGCHKERCLYMHEDFPCKYYHTGAKCFSGDRCKFSHDPLTDESRKALEMRVAPEDIIDVDNPDDDDSDYDYQHRNYESRSRPSLLGSPPRQQNKKIPSLFDIEVHPPAPSPKPSPSSVRPSGFYNEAGSSPPSSGSSTGSSQAAPINNNNNNNNNNTSNNVSSNGTNNAINNQAVGGPGMMRPGNPNMSGPGLLQTPSMPPVAGAGPLGPMIGAPGAGNRPPLIGNPPLRPGMPFLTHPNNNPPSGNLPPVLNMLGAIIREAALQKVNNTNPVNMNMNNMGGMNMGPNNLNNMPPNSMNNTVQNNMNNMGPNNAMHGMGGANVMNNMMQGSMNSGGPNGMNNMGPNNMGHMMQGMNQMGPNNMNSMGPNSMNVMVPNSMNQMTTNDNMGNNSRNMANDNIAMNFNMAPSNNRNSEEQEDMMDVDYRIKQNFDDDKDDVSQDLTELDSIRRHLQEQINKEEAEEDDDEQEEEENKMGDSNFVQDVEQSSEKTNDKTDLSPHQREMSPPDTKTASQPQSDKNLETIEIPSHLPKKQRELFMRIQQQHILREREKEKQEALRAAEEVEMKDEKDDWYSDSDEDEEKTNISTSKDEQKLASKMASSDTPTSAPATPSTFNIMQMINAIRKQGTSSTVESKTHATASSLSDPANSHSRESGHTIETKAPASPPASPPSQTSIPSFFPTVQAEEPPVISATPVKPLKYAIVRINLIMPKTYTIIPDDVDISNPAYRFDPRIKRHLQLVDKQLPAPKEMDVRRNSMDNGEKSAKLVDPRLKRAPTDPRLAKMGGGSPNSGRSDEGRPVDPRLKKDSSQTRVDPRLAKRSGSGGNDPRLNRQISQDPNTQMMGGTFGGNNNLMGPMNSMSGPMNNIGGPINSIGGPMNNMAGPMNNMVGPMNNMGVFGTNQMSSPMNGPPRPMQGGGPMNNMNRMGGPMPPMGNPVNNMGMPMNNMGGNRMSNPMVGNPQNNMMGAQSLMGGPHNRMVGPKDMPGPMSNMSNQLPPNFPDNTNDLRLRPPPDPRLNDPRFANKSQETQDQGMVRTDPRLMNSQQRSKDSVNDPRLSSDPRLSNDPRTVSDPRLSSDPRTVNDPRLSNDPRTVNDPRLSNDPRSVNDPRLSNDPRTVNDPRLSNDPRTVNDPRLSNDPRTVNDPRLSSDPRRASGFNPGVSSFSRVSDRRSPNNDMTEEREAFSSKGSKNIIEPLPSLSPSASLPPLPSLSPPASLSYSLSSSVADTQTSSKESSIEVQKNTKKFDYRNDPRFKRVKRTAAARQSSMEYSSPLGDDGEGQNNQELSGSSQYNSYNRPKPSGTSSPHRQNAPSPSLPDTLQDFDSPDLPPLSVSETVNEPDLKVKDLFKTIDPTASPFC